KRRGKVVMPESKPPTQPGSAAKEDHFMAATPRPMTGKEFLESLDDGREVWIYGERVGKITEHPAFRNAARMLARLFDALHDPALKPKLTVKSDAGHDTHAWFRVPYSAAAQVQA